jgi:hypothetical protein
MPDETDCPHTKHTRGKTATTLDLILSAKIMANLLACVTFTDIHCKVEKWPIPVQVDRSNDVISIRE